ncbi:dTDP-4-dehydrorhamnose reductase [Mesorhizobium sp. M4B.F.Ca.ET.215.01.1.1]|uniref:dTDP-4-dehydrorhamnose reductase n=1 Tax=unclassified Mesorhizobium TaxID=325217 RepID=UPI000FCC7AA4|nr:MULTISPECIES: dTDP-4-dehydrorhamnose reductase [unclassified Mesorhizobium]RUW24714.1 dTDP-4-dehydrorhamnose reductase [Mesorhizobium sp. M4B.F.Ca.ET.013.02.1.1]RVD44366.1 dTDP-4-dehydrorhamnose reductase [Mesorhizobium sp. M4B.F.Ca.ET.019.03.1.1]RWF66366.1 MAG: dTDP-4-dehydrorhamnose reductase [Mesorhizobium sp.]TGQ18889.1 dTDP-4-dehydrorhamnose reductase [Mesorhizobium sp. M4B.F.Ca.ET.215.01.1.1]TGQ43658.1 dTDP-4-dehydrorhamnose reductase [Mesorhizobium sp. M4B.F.Ca.ET.214.01.1.1]
MRIAVTGREGQIAASLLEAAQGRSDMEVVAVGRPQLDLARPDTVFKALEASRPDIIVSAAAYTAVDQAEDEPDLAFAVNAEGAGTVAEAAARLGVPVIHLSTDYVFDGTKDGAYVETDAPAPLGVYGASKLAGEVAVAAANPRHLILRTAWVYSPFGRNFVKTMLRLAGDRDEIAVVADQWGTPTSALDIADAILHVAAVLHGDKDFVSFGIYHLAGTGETTWSGFARHILEISKALGGPHAGVREIATRDYPTKARRPANSRLSTAKFAVAFGWTAPKWRASAEIVVAHLVGNSRNLGRRSRDSATDRLSGLPRSGSAPIKDSLQR